MGVTSQLPSICQNHCIAVPASPLTNTMSIDIPLLLPEEPEHRTLPLGGAHAIPAATTPKTSWKPRISLTAEVNDLLNWGMADDSSCESEHSAAGKVAAAEAVMSLSHMVEVPAPPVDTSSQASVVEGKASLESNPVNVSPTTAAYSSCSGSPMVDLTELQMDANLAADHMISVKRSTDLKRQKVIWELCCTRMKPKRLQPTRKPKFSILKRS